MLGLGLIQVINLFLIFHCNEQPLLSWSFFIFQPSTFDFDRHNHPNHCNTPLRRPVLGSRNPPPTARAEERTWCTTKQRWWRRWSNLGVIWWRACGRNEGKQRWRQWWSWWCVPGGVLKRPSCVCGTRGTCTLQVYSLYLGRKTIEKQTANVKSL